jgi:hypothetical protein
MKKYIVVDMKNDESYGLKEGDIVTKTNHRSGSCILFRLPKHLYGMGHRGHNKNDKCVYKLDNYKWLLPYQVKEVKENDLLNNKLSDPKLPPLYKRGEK